MGLPRYVANIVNASLVAARKDPHYVAHVIAYRIRVEPEFLSKVRSSENNEGLGAWHLCECTHKNHHRKQYKPAVKIQDELEKVKAQLYDGINADGKPEFREVYLSRLSLPRLQRRNVERMAQDREEVALRNQILAVENKVYASRNFPPSVRAMIFARDGFCCQACGRSRDELIREGSHLQVDHKLAWGDGGKTCYSNGETLCRECNHAKHTTKKYWHAKEALWGQRE